ncbi:MAG: hypothetical protein H6704_25075 [Myxococcales bacterium]|nr:hypothetical protein [Myxococcales bacterium]
MAPDDCLAACARADACGLTVPFGGCAAACARAAQPISACAPSPDAACDAPAWRACLADLAPRCADACAVRRACNLRGAETCPADCLAQATDPDPLAAMRADSRLACLAGADDDCVAATACLDAPTRAATLPNSHAFCLEVAACRAAQPDAPGFDCVELHGLLFAQGGWPALRCGLDHLARRCDFDAALRCLDRPPPAVDCGTICAARAACDGADGAACRQTCAGLLDGPALEVERRLGPWLCDEAPDCAALQACEAAADPEAVCAERCAGCDAGCVDDCVADLPRARLSAEGCPAPAPPCALHCAALRECGQRQPGDTCEADCADAFWRDPLPRATFLRCVARADACLPPAEGHAVSQCVRDATVGGLDCPNLCRADACGGADDLYECLVDCARGGRAAEIEASGACLRAAGADADCATLTACRAE